MSDWDGEYTPPGMDVPTERAQQVLDLAVNLYAVKDARARKLMVRTMQLLVDSIQELTGPAPIEKEKPGLVTYLGAKT